MFVTGGCRGNCCRAIRLHVAEPIHDASDEVWCFCPVTLTCSPAPAMLKPRTMHTAVTCLDRVYVIGGRTNGTREGAPHLLEVTQIPLQLYSRQKYFFYHNKYMFFCFRLSITTL